MVEWLHKSVVMMTTRAWEVSGLTRIFVTLLRSWTKVVLTMLFPARLIEKINKFPEQDIKIQPQNLESQ